MIGDELLPQFSDSNWGKRQQRGGGRNDLGVDLRGDLFSFNPALCDLLADLLPAVTVVKATTPRGEGTGRLGRPGIARSGSACENAWTITPGARFVPQMCTRVRSKAGGCGRNRQWQFAVTSNSVK